MHVFIHLTLVMSKRPLVGFCFNWTINISTQSTFFLFFWREKCMLRCLYLLKWNWQASLVVLKLYLTDLKSIKLESEVVSGRIIVSQWSLIITSGLGRDNLKNHSSNEDDSSQWDDKCGKQENAFCSDCLH